jgi:hypothetical protein
MEDLYELTGFNPIGKNKKKTLIILTDTRREYRKYINSLKYRYNKNNPYLPNYVISKSGENFKIIDPENYSKFMENEEIDKKSIVISLENLGWLKKIPLNNTYVNWVGDIYNKEVFEKRWRDYSFWDIYTENQINTLSTLILELCDMFDIPLNFVETNVKLDGIEKFKGIACRSNFDFIYKDVNPSFDFKLLKQKIEND